MEPKRKKMAYNSANFYMNLGVALAYIVLGIVVQFQQNRTKVWTAVAIGAVLLAVGVIIFSIYTKKGKNVERGDERAQINLMRANSFSYTIIMLAMLLLSTVGRMFGFGEFAFSWPVVYFIIAGLFLVPAVLFVWFDKKGA